MSPVLQLNLSEAQSFSPLPDDTYPVVVESVSEVYKGAKSSYVTVTLTIEDGHEYAGRKFWHNLMVDGKAAGTFLDFVNKCLGTNYTVDEFRDSGIEIDTDELEGAKLFVVSKQEEYPEGSGNFRSRVKNILSR